jgi:hypothetical protein
MIHMKIDFREFTFYEVGCIRGGRFGAAYPLDGFPFLFAISHGLPVGPGGLVGRGADWG